MPLFIFQNLYLRKKIRLIYEETWRLNAQMFKWMQEFFSKTLILKVFSLENYQRHAYLRLLIQNLRLGLRGIRLSLLNSLSAEFLFKLIFGLISLYGGWLIIKGHISLGAFTATMIYLTQLGMLIKSLALNFAYLNQDVISVNKFFEILERDPVIKDAPGALKLDSLREKIEFRDLWFSYSSEKEVLRGVNLKIPAGSWVGIAGPSGCGKTTLVNLLLRFYDPLKGEILLDGIELEKVKLKSLREKITPATQEPLLFDLSFRENIAIGLRHISQEEIEAAAKIAQLHNFVSALPQGYDTAIGESACKLSQGYKQRVCLARAIARKPDLLILDEATSSIDSATEEKILNALRERRRGLSTIVISHRLSTIKDADCLFFFRSDGRIEEGTHAELLAKSPQYRDFFRNQMAQEEEEFARESQSTLEIC
jgi:ABC-type multidrug transport system fused ATPase/permease subunit